MNRHERRALAAGARQPDRRAAIMQAADFLAHKAAQTATGATLILPDGETLFISADAARAMVSAKPAGWRN